MFRSYLEEIVKLSKDFKQVLPCVDFSHLHARTNGLYNTYDEFCKIFETIGTEIGSYALENFHAHIAGIEYGEKGEKKHLMLKESDMNYKDLMKAFKKFDVKGVRHENFADTVRRIRSGRHTDEPTQEQGV